MARLKEDRLLSPATTRTTSKLLSNLLSLTLLFLLATSANSHRPRPNILKRRNPTYAPLAEPSLSALTSLTDLSIINFHEPTSALSRLLVPRTAGSQNLTDLQNMVTAHFTRLKWHVEKDKFDAMTPYGVKTFTNLIFTHDPEANRRLVLSAHLDSKFFPTHPEDQFVGATDSAAPCAMMLDVAESLTGWLDARRDRILKEGGEEGCETQGETLQMVFFDGEEAFKMWTGEDSIYGAKCVLSLVLLSSRSSLTCRAGTSPPSGRNPLSLPPPLARSPQLPSPASPTSSSSTSSVPQTPPSGPSTPPRVGSSTNSSTPKLVSGKLDSSGTASGTRRRTMMPRASLEQRRGASLRRGER